MRESTGRALHLPAIPGRLSRQETPARGSAGRERAGPGVSCRAWWGRAGQSKLCLGRALGFQRQSALKAAAVVGKQLNFLFKMLPVANKKLSSCVACVPMSRTPISAGSCSSLAPLLKEINNTGLWKYVAQ